MSNTVRARRGLLSLAALAAVSGSALCGTGTAFAQQADPSASTIDPTKTATLVVHKYSGSTTNLPANGTAQTVTNPTLAGVEFTAWQVMNADGTPVDLTTNAGWQAAAAVNGGTVTQTDIAAGQFVVNGTTYLLRDSQELATGADGTVRFADKALGLYLVAETPESTDTITSSDGKTITGANVSGINPFFVTLPMTNPDTRDTWMYTVNAYPKNSIDEITKTVTDKGTVTGDQTNGTIDATAPRLVDYTLTSSIPSQSAATIGNYVIFDKLEAGVVGQDVKVVAGTATLALGTDYNVFVNDAAWTSGAMPDGAKIEIALTQAGITAMKAQDPAAKVVTTISANVAAEGADHTLLNTAFLMPSNSWWATNTGQDAPYSPATNDINTAPTGGTAPQSFVQSSTVASVYGDLNITKTDTAGTTPLAGAVFDVYQDKTPDGTCSAPADLGTKLMTGVTTDDGGLASVKGLQVSNYANDVLAPAGTYFTTYCLVETKAPDGYNLLAQPIGFTIDAVQNADGTFTVTPKALPVKNELSNLGNSLPLTGGQGAAAVAGLSLLAAGAAGGYVVYRRRQDKREDEALNA